MPEISRFFGIIISMFYDEHNPPHFHARYDEHKIAVGINTLQVLEG
jgi:phosphomannomutase